MTALLLFNSPCVLIFMRMKTVASNYKFLNIFTFDNLINGTIYLTKCIFNFGYVARGFMRKSFNGWMIVDLKIALRRKLKTLQNVCLLKNVCL